MEPGTPDPGRLPLPTLLSQALVAFTIEFDNAAEQQIPHRTTRFGSTPGGVWLVSMNMWLNCMRYVGPDPISVGEVERLARSGTNLAGMRRWGYLRLERDPSDPRPKPPDKDLLARATRRGIQAREVWFPLTGLIEARWRERFGAAEIHGLTRALRALAGQFGDSLPDCLPILGHGLWSIGRGPRADRYPAADAPADSTAADSTATDSTATDSTATGSHDHTAGSGDWVAELAVPWLLARVLLAFAIEFERQSPLSLAVSANLLRVLDPVGVQVRDLPPRSGVSKEAIGMATGFTGARRLTVIEPGPGGRWKIARLTPEGVRARAAYLRLLDSVEDGWHSRFGGTAVGELRTALERLVGSGGADSPLLAGLEPPPGTWRAAVRRPQTLPHYPMVLHRGGFPDGS